MSLCLRGIYIETRLFDLDLETAGFTEGLRLSGDAVLYSFFPGLFTLKFCSAFLFTNISTFI